jgi:hypothetical protein
MRMNMQTIKHLVPAVMIISGATWRDVEPIQEVVGANVRRL